MKIPLSKINTEQSVQVRAVIHQDTVDRYAEHVLTPRSTPLPPILIFGPDSRGMYFLSEGWHRYEAHKKAKRETILATVKEGGWKDALEHALGSNATHGLPRTNKDKRRVEELALKHWATWSSHKIAEKCAVGDDLVNEVRKCQVSENDTCQPRTVIGKDGKTYKVGPPPSRPPTSKPPDRPPPSKSSDNNPDVVKPEPEEIQPLETSTDADELPKDDRGKTVLPHLLNLWEGRTKLVEMAKALRDVRLDVEQAVNDRDPLFCGSGQGVSPVSCQSLVAAIKRAEAEIKSGIPYAVCGCCNGTGCRGCSGNGMVTELQFSRLAPEYRR